MPPPLSIALTTLNEEARLGRCLRSIEGLAAEIVVVDSGSTDGTRTIAESFGARVLSRAWSGHRDQKQAAIDACTQPWALILDADEELSPELRASIQAFFRDGTAEKFQGASCNRKVHFLGRWITHGDWYPDRKLRLVRHDRARMGGTAAHDKVELDGRATHLAGDLHHYSFPDINAYLAKIGPFADEFVKQQIEVGARWSLLANITRPLWRFFRAYVLRRGFLDGFPGLWIATATAFSTFVRYSRKFEHERTSPPSE